MVRLSPRRGQRSNGLKVKHYVQLTVLLGLGIWLIYQMKHSHEKKADFEDGYKIIKLGRKDLNQRIEETTNVKDEIGNEGIKNDESFNGDIGTDDQFGKESGGDENAEERIKETEGTGNEGKDEEIEKVTDESDGGNEEDREKNYKGDDASSEVIDGEKVEVEEESISDIIEHISFRSDQSVLQTEEFKDSVVKNVSSNTTEENGEIGSDDGEQKGTKNESDSKSGEKGFSDSNGVLPETNQSTGYQETKNEEEEKEKVQTFELSSQEESEKKEKEDESKSESDSEEFQEHTKSTLDNSLTDARTDLETLTESIAGLTNNRVAAE